MYFSVRNAFMRAAPIGTKAKISAGGNVETTFVMATTGRPWNSADCTYSGSTTYPTMLWDVSHSKYRRAVSAPRPSPKIRILFDCTEVMRHVPRLLKRDADLRQTTTHMCSSIPQKSFRHEPIENAS